MKEAFEQQNRRLREQETVRDDKSPETLDLVWDLATEQYDPQDFTRVLCEELRIVEHVEAVLTNLEIGKKRIDEISRRRIRGS